MRTFDQVDLVEIEGQPGDARLLAACLEERGSALRTLTFGDGDEALEYLDLAGRAGMAPGVVLLDLHLHGFGGVQELARRLRDLERDRPVRLVIWSGSPDPDDARRARELGARLFLRKPHDLEGFQAVACLLESLSKAARGAEPTAA